VAQVQADHLRQGGPLESFALLLAAAEPGEDQQVFKLHFEPGFWYQDRKYLLTSVPSM
jgi:hypothetical protein